MRDPWKFHNPTSSQREQIEVIRKAFRAAKDCLEACECCDEVYCQRAQELLEQSFCLAERGVVLFEPEVA